MNEVVDNGNDMNRLISASSRANITTAEKATHDSMEAVTEDLKRATARLLAQQDVAACVVAEGLGQDCPAFSGGRYARFEREPTSKITDLQDYCRA